MKLYNESVQLSIKYPLSMNSNLFIFYIFFESYTSILYVYGKQSKHSFSYLSDI